jgi:hypothetical protein
MSNQYAMLVSWDFGPVPVSKDGEDSKSVDGILRALDILGPPLHEFDDNLRKTIGPLHTTWAKCASPNRLGSAIGMN